MAKRAFLRWMTSGTLTRRPPPSGRPKLEEAFDAIVGSFSTRVTASPHFACAPQGHPAPPASCTIYRARHTRAPTRTWRQSARTEAQTRAPGTAVSAHARASHNEPTAKGTKIGVCALSHASSAERPCPTAARPHHPPRDRGAAAAPRARPSPPPPRRGLGRRHRPHTASTRLTRAGPRRDRAAWPGRAPRARRAPWPPRRGSAPGTR